MEILIKELFIALALGAFIGLQFRKKAEEGNYQDHAFAGMRTCMAITLLGYLGAYLTELNPHLFLVFSAFVLILILLSYAQSSFQDNHIGGTSEITLAILYIVGILVGFELIEEATVVTIVLSIISAGRDELYRISDKFTKLEIIETVKFAIIIFLILPLLPNEAIDPWGVINPYTIWLMVIIISGIGFLGYMASKFIGKQHGILLSGFIGGAIASTAVTTTMAIENKRQPKLVNVFSLAILLSTIMMYFRVMLEAFVLNPEILQPLAIPIGGMLVTMIGFIIWNYYYQKPSKEPKLKKEIEIETPLALGPALKFSLFFVFILILIKLSQVWLGNQGVYITSVISALADVDAITISLSNLSAAGEMTNELATRGITYAIIANTLIKVIYVHFFGTAIMRNKMALALGVTSGVGVALSLIA